VFFPTYFGEMQKMKSLRFWFLAAGAALFAVGCTSSTSTPPSVGGSNTTISEEDHAGHSHDEHGHEGHSHDEAAPAETPSATETPAESSEAAPATTDEFGAPPAEPQPPAAGEQPPAVPDQPKETTEPEISLDPANPDAAPAEETKENP
jgi:hypothetical protein